MSSLTTIYSISYQPARVIGTCFCGRSMEGRQQPIDRHQFYSLLICNDYITIKKFAPNLHVTRYTKTI